MGRGLRADADSIDLVQATFLKAIPLLSGFEVRHEAGLIHWLAKIAESEIRAAADRRRTAKRDPRREVAWQHVRDGLESGSLRLEPATPETLPLLKLEKAEFAALVEQCIAELPEAQREVILLRDYEGGSWEFVAEHLGVKSPDAARMLYGRAKLALVKALRSRDRAR